MLNLKTKINGHNDMLHWKGFVAFYFYGQHTEASKNCLTLW